MKNIFILVLVCVSSALSAQSFSWKTVELYTQTTIRGLSVVDDKVAWISGSNGWVGQSLDGGNTWSMRQLTDYDSLNFRSIYAFNDKKAIIANAGSPAYILLTQDGGLSWTLVYANQDTAAFLDGIDFRNDKEGIVYGDPLNGQMLLLRTNDGGLHWNAFPEAEGIKLLPGEASFAASGTGLRMTGKQKIVIATGGKVSRLVISNNNGKSWKFVNPPILQGSASTGIFSVACSGNKEMIVVGGDYLADSLSINNIFYTLDDGNHWIAPLKPIRGYRECVEYIDSKTIIATGPTGTDISYDRGINWQALSDERNNHVIRKARKGKLILVAGKGNISILSKL